MDSAMTKALEDALGLAANVARHFAWLVSHHVQGSPRQREDR
jgi:hypothetical protein